MSLAIDLDQVYRACNPDKPLDATDTRYVDLSVVRGTRNIATTIARRIARCEAGAFHQQLFTGHRGSGKSTELLRLQQALEQQNFFAIYIDVEEQLDLADLDYLDVLLSMAKQTEEALRNTGISLNQDLLINLGNWFAEKIIEQEQGSELTSELTTQAEAKTTIPVFASLMARLTAEIKTASSRRTTTRQKLEREQAVFIMRLNELLENARSSVKRSGHKDIVLIVDGLEKMHYRLLEDGKSSYEHLFVLHAEQLKAPRCHLVYTLPIPLVFNANLGNDFDDVQLLPMVKICSEGVKGLRQVVAERIDIKVTFTNPDDLNELIQLSGGVVRDLMRLLRWATETDAEQITAPDIVYAKQALIREYDRLLRNDEFEKVMWIKKHRRVPGDEGYARMLHQRLILEYQNGDRWADIHPAVMEIPWVKQRMAQEQQSHAGS